MNQGQFDQQIQRLVNNFGKQAYSSERALLLWREVQGFESRWFQFTVDKFIGEFRQAPLLNDFREEIAKERERLHRIEKAQHSQDAEDFFAGTYQPEDIRMICQQIVKRLCGNLTDEDFDNFMNLLNRAPKKPNRVYECSQCNNSGVHFVKKDDYEYVYRCKCPAGKKRPENYPFYE